MARFGSLGTQYFDDSGEVLSGGYIQFYLSGTSTPMDTYADINQAIENEWPVPLDASGYQPNIFFEGSAKAVLRNSAGTMIAYADPVGETDGAVAFQRWIPSYRYGLGAVVQGSDYNFYQSEVANNLGNDPVSSPSEWELFGDVLIRENTINKAKGSLLVGNGTEVVELPAGTNGYVLGYDDTEPQGLIPIPLPENVRNYQAFTSSGTWTKPDDVEFVLVELWSGGGGGANNTASTGDVGGGGGGEYVWGIFRASALAATVSVTIGAGGAGGANGVSGNGSVGGNSSFGAHLVAIGGNPGINAANTVCTVPRSLVASASTSGAGAAYTVAVFPQAGIGGYSGSGAGGNTLHGGGGGGNAGGAGGVSARGGSGGAGNNTLNTKGGNGSAPAGGGGASGNNGGGGDGARGEARVWSW